jgi:urease gamma subunit
MNGYSEYSDFELLTFRCGKVHKKALAKRQAICIWLNDIEWLWVCFNKGIGLVTNVGNCNAKLMIFGNKLLKNSSVSSSVKHYINKMVIFTNKIIKVYKRNICTLYFYCTIKFRHLFKILK